MAFTMCCYCAGIVATSLLSYNHCKSSIDDVACSKNPQIIGDIYRGLTHNVTSCEEIFVGHFCAMCKGGFKIIQKIK